MTRGRLSCELLFYAQPLPQLHIGQETPPLGHPVVLVQLSNLRGAQGSSASLAISSGRVPPRGSVDDLVSESEAKDDQDSDHVLEEVFSCESGASLSLIVSHTVLCCSIVWRQAWRIRATYNWLNTRVDTADQQEEGNQHQPARS